MRSFRAKRQSDQWGLDGETGWSDVAGAESFDESASLVMSSGSASSSWFSSGVAHLGRHQSTSRITLPASEDRDLGSGRLVNEEAVYSMRKKWISDRLIERESIFCRYSSISVFCGTYNVAGKKSEGEDLGPWLLQCTGEPDVYAIGFQEIVGLTAVNVAVSDSKSQQRAAMWRQKVEQFLSTRKNRYRLVEHRSLVGIVLYVYVQEKHDRFVQDVQATTAGVGMMGMMGNKGAVVVRLSLYDSTLCFVCAHMAAQRSNVAGRNANFWSILGKIAFSGDPETAWEFRGLPCEFSRGRVDGGVRILDHDLVFWLGDLNYRVSEGVYVDDVFDRVRTKEGREYLLAHDQLNLERARGPRAAFGEFEEAPMKFAPTYKYQPGTQLYEERPDKKRRAPAWCDRVLWRSRDPGHISSMRYDTADLVLSDHKPVCSELSVKVRRIEGRARLRAFEEVTGLISQVESLGLAPELSLGASFLNLGNVYFRREAAVVLRVANVGQGLAFLRFTPKLDETVPFKRWLKVEPAFALLTPGERTEFRVSVRVDRLTARELCAGFEVLEETLVLRLEGGAEHYVPVFGRYASPAFGASLEDLAAKHGTEAARLGIPFELWRLVDHMVKGGALRTAAAATELFPPMAVELPGDAPLDDDTTTILRCLDTGAEFPPSITPPAFATAMVVFLSALPEPVVPVSAVKAVENELAAHRPASGGAAGGGGAWMGRLLRALSPAQHNTFLYITIFLRQVAEVGRPAGLRSGPLASFMCDALCFQDMPWLGFMGAGGGETSGGGVDSASWPKHRDMFRAILGSCISATR